MNLPAQALSILDTALRVPPLFIMDEILKCCFGFSNNIHARYSNFFSDENPFLNDEGFGHLQSEELRHWPADNDTTVEMEDYPVLSTIALTLAKILMFILVYLLSTVAFLLSSQRLMQVYLVVGSLVVVVVGYQLNVATLLFLAAPPQSDHPALLYSLLSLNTTAIWGSGTTVSALGANYLCQGGLGYLFTVLHAGPAHPLLHRLLVLSFLSPSLSVLLPLPEAVLSAVPLFAALLPLAVVKYVVASNLLRGSQVVMGGYQYARNVMREFGLHSLLESEWVRLNVPNVLRTFWLVRAANHVVLLLGEFMYARGEQQTLWDLDVGALYVIFKAVMTQGCETAVALLGMTSIVSYVSHYVGVAFQMVLLTVEDDDRSMGTVCAILFFILAEQSGLTVMEGEKRFVRLCRNFCLIFTAMLHFIHNMVNPVLMSLSASRNPALYRHARALLVCSLLVLLPAVLLYVLWSFYPLSTWLLAVSAFSVQVVVKTLVSVLIYGLFLVDAYRAAFWERLDDYVYYIRAFGNSVEFVFGILLFFNGAWIYLFESGGSIRAFMMCIHAYFNIWCEARNGWTVFMKRRTAVNKINSLPEASEAQLLKHDDVCAICFQALHSARITRCNHYFHSVCLRKWLYVQDSCPLCHETLYKVEVPEEQQGGQAGGTEAIWDIVAEEGTPDPPVDHGGEADSPVWDQQDIDLILGENMGGGQVVVDQEVGEVVLQPPQQPTLPTASQEGLDSDTTHENNQVFNLRLRRGHIIDQDIGQQ
ncbi:protein TRC8 homolog [Eriocheir sinensis]|uniref:protein TRC8 homolog n=1 Tax=Eriocheir sinensis TaxID=95602 RepID=UPI0021C584E7|nr:protein TRC8 homolog [Eriocheir sinensis]